MVGGLGAGGGGGADLQAAAGLADTNTQAANYDMGRQLQKSNDDLANRKILDQINDQTRGREYLHERLAAISEQHNISSTSASTLQDIGQEMSDNARQQQKENTERAKQTVSGGQGGGGGGG